MEQSLYTQDNLLKNETKEKPISKWLIILPLVQLFVVPFGYVGSFVFSFSRGMKGRDMTFSKYILIATVVSVILCSIISLVIFLRLSFKIKYLVAFLLSLFIPFIIIFYFRPFEFMF